MYLTAIVTQNFKVVFRKRESVTTIAQKVISTLLYVKKLCKINKLQQMLVIFLLKY